MSLTVQQEEDTRRQLKENFIKSGLSIKTVALDLGTTEEYICDLFNLLPNRLEDTWILRNYLIDKVESKGESITEFTALVGSWHDYWFLDGDYIDKGIIK